MAHAIVEWTANLKGQTDIHALLQLIAKAMRDADGIFPWGGIRVRAIRLDDYVIADDSGQDAFVNVTVKMGAGRSDAFKAAFFGELFETMKRFFQPLFDSRYLALSLYVEEADERGSFKHNNLHARFKKGS